MEPNTKSKQRENKPPLIYFQVPLENLGLTLLDLGRIRVSETIQV